jgi:hypothetical protein
MGLGYFPKVLMARANRRAIDFSTHRPDTNVKFRPARQRDAPSGAFCVV